MTTSTEFKIDFLESPIIEVDSSQLTPEMSREGFFTFTAKVARIGNQVYQNSDGETYRVENRPEEEVIKSLDSFGNKPVTFPHPYSGFVLPSNSKTFQVGHTHKDVSFKKGYVEVAITLTDEEAIKAIQEGFAQEFSAGYLAKVEPVKGDWFGQPYTHKQSDIYVNHIALVDRARAGSEAKINNLESFQFNKVDGYSLLLPKHQEQVDADKPIKVFVQIPNYRSQNIDISNLNSKERKMGEVQLDVAGKPVMLSEIAASVVSDKIQKDKSTIDELTTKLAELQNKSDSAMGDYKAQLAQKATTIETLEAKIADAESQLQTMVKTENLQAMIDARVALQNEAARFLGKDFSFAGISDSAVKKAVIDKIYGDKIQLDNASDVEIKVAYNMALLSNPNYQTRAAGDTTSTTKTTTDSASPESGIVFKTRQAAQDAATNADGVTDYLSGVYDSEEEERELREKQDKMYAENARKPLPGTISR